MAARTSPVSTVRLATTVPMVAERDAERARSRAPMRCISRSPSARPALDGSSLRTRMPVPMTRLSAPIMTVNGALSHAPATASSRPQVSRTPSITCPRRGARSSKSAWSRKAATTLPPTPRAATRAAIAGVRTPSSARTAVGQASRRSPPQSSPLRSAAQGFSSHAPATPAPTASPVARSPTRIPWWVMTDRLVFGPAPAAASRASSRRLLRTTIA